MRIPIRNSKHQIAGLLFLTLGIATFFLSQDYPMGTAANMGPGYFPTLLGVILAIIGGAAVVQSFVKDLRDPVRNIELIPLVMLTLSIVAFGLLVEPLGLVAAIFALVILSSYRRLLSKPVEVLTIAVVLSVFCVGVFVYSADLGFHLGPRW